MPRIEKIRPIGNMDKDSDIINVGKGTGSGNTIDNRNTQISPDSGTGLGSITPTLGNEFAFSLGSVSAQNKRYRVTVIGDPSKSHSIRFLSTKRNVNIITGTGTDGAVDFVGTATSLEASFISAMIATGTSVWITSVSGNSVEFEMTSIPHYDWFLTSTGVDDVQIVCVQEAIPTNLAGPLKDIGSYDLLGDLFIFSTSQDELPNNTYLHVFGVGLGQTTSITFSSNHNFNQGEWIRIRNSNADWLNGTFVIQSIPSQDTINIITDSYWGVVNTPFLVGEEIITSNPIGIGEIGVAIKDNNTESWTYTRLLRSVELNLVSKKAVECFAEIDFRRRSIYYTDNRNRPRVFYYYGDYTLDGALSAPNIYEYGSISSESSLQPPSSPVTVSIVEQISTGGNLKPGLKYYAVQQLTENGDEGPITSLLGPFIVYDEDNNVDGVTYSHEIAGVDTTTTTTDKRHRISINNLDGEVYSIGRIIYIEVIGGAVSANEIHTFNISGPTYEYIHTGYENTNQFDIGEIFANPANASSSVIRAKSIDEVDSRNILSNVGTIADIDLSEWAESIRHELIYDEYPESTLKEIGEFQDTITSHDGLGLMINETYRIGVRVHIKGFGWTNYYWVDDIKIDTLSTNTANINDNRRDSGLPHYELSAGFISPINSFETDPSVRSVSSNFTDSNGLPSTSPEYIGTRISVPNGTGWLQYFRDSDNIYSPTAVYRTPKIKFNINWDFFSEDILDNLLDAVNAVEFGIGDIQRSVKASGYSVMSIKFDKQAFSPSSPDPVLGSVPSYPTDGTIYEFPFHPYWATSLTTPTINSSILPNYPFTPTSEGSNFAKADEVRDIVSFYSPEQIVGGNGTISNASKLISIGSAMTYKFLCGSSVALPNSVHGYFSLFHPQGDMNTATFIDIDESAFISDVASIFDFSNGDRYTRMDSSEASHPLMDNFVNNAPYYPFRLRKNDLPVFRLSSPIPNYAETEIRKQQRGVIYSQLYNDESANFPSKGNTNYTKIGDTITFNEQPSRQIVINGGDTANSLFYFKQRSLLYLDQNVPFNGIIHEGSLMGMVCQTRINIKALNPYENNPERALYPFQYGFGTWSFQNPSVERTAIEKWRAHPTDPTFLSPVPINNIYEEVTDYSFNNQFIRVIYPSFSYFQNIGSGNEKQSRIVWSLRKIENSITDNYRIFKALDFKDISPTFGQIEHHKNVNGELFTLQPRKYQLQYFNARGSLQTSSSSTEVLIGDGSVLARDGQTLSIYGTSHKWSVIKGVSKGGKDVLYWFNVENGVMMRFGSDGTGVISERGMTSYFANYTKWLKDKNEHAYEQGVRGVWDDRRKEAIWTFTAWRNVSEWQQSTSFLISTPIGTVVTNPNAQSDSYEGFPMIFRCKVAHVNQPSNEPFVGIDWQQYWDKIDYNDSNYYSIFTICFNEITNGFRCFYGHLPKTYLKWQNTFLSSHPTKRNLIFEHRKGEYTTWYGVQNAFPIIQPKIEDAYFESVVNDVPEQNVRAVAVSYLSESAPDRVEYRTGRHYTWDTSSEFEKNDDSFFAPIRDDASVTGSPDLDGEPLSGSYVRIKFIFFGGAYNKLSSMVIKMFDRLRRISR